MSIQGCQCYCHQQTIDNYPNGCYLCTINHAQPTYPQYPQMLEQDAHYKIIAILNEIKSILLDIKNEKKTKPRTRKTTRSKNN